MCEEMIYTMPTGGYYKQFLADTLNGQLNKRAIQQIIVVLEIVITEMKNPDYQLKLSIDSQGVRIEISHSGRPINSDLLSIVSDLIDRSYYSHPSRNRHVLTIRKTKSND